MSKKSKRSRSGQGISDEDRKVGSRKCILKAMQLLAVLDELYGIQFPVTGKSGESLDDVVRMLEIDPFSQSAPSPKPDMLLDPGYGLTSLMHETLFAQSLSWWAKAQWGNQQKDKYLRKNMYASPLCYQHFMDRRNNLTSHFPNSQRDLVPGEHWLIARGYFPIADSVLKALKCMLVESLCLLLPLESREGVSRMLSHKLGIDGVNITELEVPRMMNMQGYSFIIERPIRLFYRLQPVRNGDRWVIEARQVDESNSPIDGGFHLDSFEVECDSWQSALRVAMLEVDKKIQVSQ